MPRLKRIFSVHMLILDWLQLSRQSIYSFHPHISSMMMMSTYFFLLFFYLIPIKNVTLMCKNVYIFLYWQSNADNAHCNSLQLVISIEVLMLFCSCYYRKATIHFELDNAMCDLSKHPMHSCNCANVYRPFTFF